MLSAETLLQTFTWCLPGKWF